MAEWGGALCRETSNPATAGTLHAGMMHAGPNGGGKVCVRLPVRHISVQAHRELVESLHDLPLAIKDPKPEVCGEIRDFSRTK